MHHLRPVWWVCIWCHFLVGAVMTVGRGVFDLPLDVALRALVGGGVWAVCLGGAAAAISTVFRGKKAGAASADAVPVPPSLGWTGLALMVIGLVAAPVLSWWYFDAYLAGIVLIVLHSVPPVRLARWSWVGVVLEGAGLGALTLHAGRCIMGTPATPDRAWVLCLFGFALVVVAIRVLVAVAWEALWTLLYAVCLVDAFACLGLGLFCCGRRWGTALAALLFLGWFALGARRHFRAGADPVARRTGGVLMLCLLTDGAAAATCVFS